MDGPDRSIGGLGRLKDVFGRLGLMEGPGLGATDLDRLDIRSCMPPLGAIDLGADWAIGDGPRFICGLGRELNDRDPIELPGFITGGLEGICGAACMLGAWLLMLCREDPLSRPRDWPQACGSADSVIPTTTATASEPTTRFLAFQDPVVRRWFLLITANIEILLSPRRYTTNKPHLPIQLTAGIRHAQQDRAE